MPNWRIPVTILAAGSLGALLAPRPPEAPRLPPHTAVSRDGCDQNGVSLDYKLRYRTSSRPGYRLEKLIVRGIARACRGGRLSVVLSRSSQEKLSANAVSVTGETALVAFAPSPLVEDVARVRLRIRPRWRPPTPRLCATLLFDDTVVGTSKSEAVVGGNGNDLLFGVAGADRLTGNAGRDCIAGGRGADIIRGWLDGDVLVGGRGRDTLSGGAGGDLLAGGSGLDVCWGGRGKDRFEGCEKVIRN